MVIISPRDHNDRGVGVVVSLKISGMKLLPHMIYTSQKTYLIIPYVATL